MAFTTDMNIRKLNIQHTQKPIFDSYSSLDVPLVKQATFWGFALTGGTAVQYLARQYSVKERRKRSINDLDFIVAARNIKIEDFVSYLETQGFVPTKMGVSEYMVFLENKEVGVEVDVMIDWTPHVEDTFVKVGPILTVSPVALFLSKVQRLTTKSAKDVTDKQDLNTLYDIIEQRGEIEKLESELSGEGFTEQQSQELNDWLQDNQ